MRCRVLYEKTEPLRYTGMLDIQHIWERLFRRAQLNLAYSQGFHPQPRIQQAAPLPLGFLSSSEILDFWLEDVLEISEVQRRIEEKTQPGLEIRHIEEVELATPPLQTRLQTAAYTVEALIPLDLDNLKSKIGNFLDETEIIRERRGKKYDLRPLTGSLQITNADGNEISLAMVLSARESATGRPDEVISALGFDPFDFRYTRGNLEFSESIFTKVP